MPYISYAHRTLTLNWGPAFDYSLGSHALMGMDGQYINAGVCFLQRKKFTITSSITGIRPRPVNICWASAPSRMAFMLIWMLPELQLVSRYHVLNLERFGFECWISHLLLISNHHFFCGYERNNMLSQKAVHSFLIAEQYFIVYITTFSFSIHLLMDT